MIPGKKYTPELVLQIAWRRKWFILIPAVAISVGAAVWTHGLSDLYQSQSTILVVPQRVPEEYVRSAITQRLEDRLAAISTQIMSRSRLERIILDLNLYPVERKTGIMEDIVEAMRREVAITPIRGDAFTVGFTSEDPRTAFRVTERLATLFIDESLKDREVLAQGTNQFLEGTLEEARRALIDNEKKREEYRRKFDGQLPDQTAANLQALNSANLQLQVLFDSLNRDHDRQMMIERNLQELQNAETYVPPPPPPVVAPAGTKTAADDLRQLQEELSIAKLRLTPDHPDITRLTRLVAVAQERADREAAATTVSPDGRNPAEVARQNRIRELNLQLESLQKAIKENQAREAKLRDTVGVYQRRIESAPTRESELVDLMRDYGVLQSNYTSTLEKYQDSRIQANLERRQIGEQFKTIEPARLPQRPFSPNRPRFYGMGILAGIAAGLGLAGLLEYLDRTMRSEDDVRVALSLPVLAAIPLVPNPAADRRRRLIAVSASAAALLVVGAAVAAWKFLR